MMWTPSLGQHPSSQVQNARNNFRRPLFQIPLKNIRPKLGRPKQNECTLQLSANTPQVKFKMFDFFSATIVSNPMQMSPTATWAPQAKLMHIPSLNQHSPKQVQNGQNNFRYCSFQTPLNNHPTLEHLNKNECTCQASANTPQVEFEIFGIIFDTPPFNPHSESIQKWSGTLIKMLHLQRPPKVFQSKVISARIYQWTFLVRTP